MPWFPVGVGTGGNDSGEGLIRSDHPDGFGGRLRERQSRRVPELDLVSLAVPLLGEGGTAMSKQPDDRQC